MPNIALPGIAATGALGTPTITGGAAPQNIDLPGIAASGTLGALTLGFVASGPQSIALSGITATGTLGIPTFSFGAPPPSGGGGGVATPGVGPNRLPYPDVVRSSPASGEVLDPRGVQANFERLASQSAKAAADVAWTALPYAATWADYPSFATGRYRVIGNQVQLTGLIRPTTAWSGLIATLPLAARIPAGEGRILVALARDSSSSNALCRLDVDPSGGLTFTAAYLGSVSTIGAASAQWLNLEGLSYAIN